MDLGRETGPPIQVPEREVWPETEPVHEPSPPVKEPEKVPA
jgi:hypothetical protein